MFKWISQQDWRQVNVLASAPAKHRLVRVGTCGELDISILVTAQYQSSSTEEATEYQITSISLAAQL